MNDMQPMETAPTDGKVILLEVKGTPEAPDETGFVVGYWGACGIAKGTFAWMAKPWPGCNFLMIIEPVSWTHLPEKSNEP